MEPPYAVAPEILYEKDNGPFIQYVYGDQLYAAHGMSILSIIGAQMATKWIDHLSGHLLLPYMD